MSRTRATNSGGGRDERARGGREALALRRQAKAAAPAIAQLEADARFERRQLRADGRLRAERRLGGRDAACVDDGQKDPDEPEIEIGSIREHASSRCACARYPAGWHDAPRTSRSPPAPMNRTGRAPPSAAVRVATVIQMPPRARVPSRTRPAAAAGSRGTPPRTARSPRSAPTACARSISEPPATEPTPAERDATRRQRGRLAVLRNRRVDQQRAAGPAADEDDRTERERRGRGRQRSSTAATAQPPRFTSAQRRRPAPAPSFGIAAQITRLAMFAAPSATPTGRSGPPRCRSSRGRSKRRRRRRTARAARTHEHRAVAVDAAGHAVRCRCGQRLAAAKQRRREHEHAEHARDEPEHAVRAQVSLSIGR